MNVPSGISAELSNINYKTKKKMKKTIILASVALATLFAFSSCQKENLQDNGTTNGVRIITAEFENNATKTELNDGVTPEWAIGDKIRILNATTYQDVDLVSGKTPPAEGKGIIKDGKIVIAIDDEITGDLYAVYPVTATSMESCNGEITFAIPAVQDGTFGSANICVAKGDDKDNLMFSNATAVLEFDAGQTGVKSVRVRAANTIAGSLTVSFGTDNRIDNSSYETTGLTSRTITAGSAEYTDSKFYVAVAPVTTGAVGFKYYKDIDKVARFDDNEGKTLLRNKIFALTIESDADKYTKDYEIIAGLKWSTQNLAITYSGNKKWKGGNTDAVTVPGTIYPTVVGDYFQWGANEGYCGNATSTDKGLLIYNSFANIYCVGSDTESKFTFKTEDEGKNYQFAKKDSDDGKNIGISPHFDKAQSKYTKYSTDGATLEYSDDAARIILGGTWRMPTKAEFEEMIAATYCKWDGTDKGYYVYAPTSGDEGGLNGKKSDKSTSISGSYTKTDALLFFPAVGLGSNTLLQFPGMAGCYWSRGVYETTHAYNLFINASNLKSDNNSDRNSGCSIRPVKDVPTTE